MGEFHSAFGDPVGWLVISGAMLQTLAHLIRDQVTLRAVLFSGTLLYIAYYYSVPTGPLWPAIAGTSLIALSSMIGLCRVLAVRLRRAPNSHMFAQGQGS
ncbi:MAG: hypothetical protein AAGF79_04945 [Pseudomonadota bacterium]